MNSGYKFALFFLGGAALGALAMGLSNKKLNLKTIKPCAVNLFSQALEIKDAASEKIERFKENIEDWSAEARQNLEDRKEAGLNANNEENGGRTGVSQC